MNRLLIWGGLALALHAVLLLVPIYDNSLESSAGSSGVSVHIQTSQSSGQVNTGEQAPAESQPEKMPDYRSALHDEVSEVKSNAEAVMLHGKFSAPSNKVSNKSFIKQEDNANSLTQNVKVNDAIAVTQVTTRKPKTNLENTIKPSTNIAQDTPVRSAAEDFVSPVESTLDLAKSDNHKNVITEKTQLISARPASKNKPKYPRRAIIRNQQGDVKVELLIKYDGLVEEAVLVESSGFPMLDKSVMRFVNKERFVAAFENGMPVDSTQLYTYRFVLE